MRSTTAKLLDIDQQRNDLKRAYYRKFKTALDPITATRFPAQRWDAGFAL
jgi:hypothetical protein